MKYKCIRNKDVIPPKGWRFYEKNTGTWIKSTTHKDLGKDVMAHREANGVPIETDFYAEIDNGLYEQLKSDGLSDGDLDRIFGECVRLGDVVAVPAQFIAKAIDAVAGTNVAGCKGCKKRHTKFNQGRVMVR